LAVKLTASPPSTKPVADLSRFASGQRYLRGLFSGGTLAYEALLILQDYLPAVYSNAPLDKDYRLANSMVSQAHTIVDLGEDEFTVGRLHPMLDNDLRIRRLQQEAGDPEVAVILLDVVLGYGAHPDPASELAPAIAEARAKAEEAGRYLEVVAIVVGTDEDPQDMDAQVQQLEEAGARVETSNEAAVRYIGRLLQALNQAAGATHLGSASHLKSVDLTVLHEPLAAINVGLESFAESLMAQGAPVIQVDWQPPAGGNERLMAILERMR
jgi:FdrA protein